MTASVGRITWELHYLAFHQFKKLNHKLPTAQKLIEVNQEHCEKTKEGVDCRALFQQELGVTNPLGQTCSSFFLKPGTSAPGPEISPALIQ